jgi:hypothetical protein
MRKPLGALIARAVREHGVDILLLAECGDPEKDLLATLQAETSLKWLRLSRSADKVQLFTHLPQQNWHQSHSENRMAIWKVGLGQPPGILLAAIHFVDKRSESEDGQMLLAAELAKEIVRLEDAVGFQRTVVVGDLNMNPFEKGLTGATTVHAVMTQQIAQRKTRIVQESEYRFFYNPMWGFFGDRTAGPPGTYYYASGTTAQFWHIFDQVLFRPELMNKLRELKILDCIAGVSLLSKRGIPNANDYSDHLPLLFQLDLD